ASRDHSVSERPTHVQVCFEDQALTLVLAAGMLHAIFPVVGGTVHHWINDVARHADQIKQVTLVSLVLMVAAFAHIGTSSAPDPDPGLVLQVATLLRSPDYAKRFVTPSEIQSKLHKQPEGTYALQTIEKVVGTLSSLGLVDRGYAERGAGY